MSAVGDHRPSSFAVTPSGSGVRLSWQQCGESHSLDGPNLEALLPHFARLTHLIRERSAAGGEMPDERDLMAELAGERDQLHARLSPN